MVLVFVFFAPFPFKKRRQTRLFLFRRRDHRQRRWDRLGVPLSPSSPCPFKVICIGSRNAAGDIARLSEEKA